MKKFYCLYLRYQNINVINNFKIVDLCYLYRQHLLSNLFPGSNYIRTL
nr:MAG TPA: hypothetical protein [Herelleviridae sp.]